MVDSEIKGKVAIQLDEITKPSASHHKSCVTTNAIPSKGPRKKKAHQGKTKNQSRISIKTVKINPVIKKEIAQDNNSVGDTLPIEAKNITDKSSIKESWKVGSSVDPAYYQGDKNHNVSTGKNDTASVLVKAKEKKPVKKESKPQVKKNSTPKRNQKIRVRSHVLTDYYPVRRSTRKPKSVLQKELDEDIVEAVISNCEDGLAVIDFEDKGRGVVATKPFKTGSFVIEYAGDHIDWEEAKKREDEYSKDPSIGCYMYYFSACNRNYCVDATVETGRLGRLLNHSKKNPNCKTKLIDVPNKKSGGSMPRLIIVAKKDIMAGEELTYDYGDRDKNSIHSHPWLKS